MFQSLLHSNGTVVKFADALQELSRRHGLYAILRAFLSPFLGVVRIFLGVVRIFLQLSAFLLQFVGFFLYCRLVSFIRSKLDGDTDTPQNWQHHLYANSRNFLARLLELAGEPLSVVFLAVDYWSLVQSIWSGRQLGPDVVYPMLRIRKRQSGRLARLILEHCNAVGKYERHVETAFPPGIDPPCVAVMDLDQVPHHIVQKGYSTRVDFYGLMCVQIFLGTGSAFISRGFHSWYWVLSTVLDRRNLAFCIYAVLRGDGTLTLARRSNMSTRGCIVLLDQDTTVILTGSQSVLEAIAERGFNLSHPNTVWRPGGRVPCGKGSYRSLPQDAIEILCDAVCLTVFALYWLLFCPSTTQLERMTPLVFTTINIVTRMQGFFPRANIPTIEAYVWLALTLPVLLIISYPLLVSKESFPLFSDRWDSVLFSLSLFALFLFAYKPRDYPITSTRFLDTLGPPLVRKWEFDTLAAAATFQCLVLCHGIPRPVESINVSAFLDMLVPDERDVWKAWKGRVADRIVHEMDISFAPTIPTFADERQMQLRDLLREAQSGYDAYWRFYG